MRDLKLVAIGVAALLGPASPSLAQEYGPPVYPYNAPPPYGYGVYDQRLSGRAIVDRLEVQGYDDVGRPRFDGSSYLVDATARGGFRVRLLVDPRNGYILRRIALRSPILRDQDEDDTAPFARRDRRPTVPYGAWTPAPYDEPGIEAPRPVQRREASRPSRPGERRSLGQPADARLAPAETPEETDAAPPKPRPAQPSPTGGLYGTNPDTPRTRPKDSIASRPAKPEFEASSEPRRPVRMIDGVTPMGAGTSAGSPVAPATR